MISSKLTGVFLDDVAIGQVAEKESQKILTSIYKDVEILESETNFPEYDFRLKVNGDNLTYEVKTDFESRYTGNVAIETHKNGKPSGINKIKADYIIYKVWYQHTIYFVMYRRENLATLLKLGFGTRSNDNAGNGNKQKVILVNVGNFILNGEIIHIMDESEAETPDFEG